MSTTSSIERLQLDIAARLEGDSYFVDIGVTVMRPRAQLGFVQIQERVDNLLSCVAKKAGRGGAGVMVLMPTLDNETPDSPAPLTEAGIIIRVQELPVHNMGPNGTQKSAEDIALNVVRVLHLFHRGQGNVVYAGRDLITPTAEFAPKVTYDVRMQQKLALAIDAKVTGVTFSSATASSPDTGWDVTLTCATSGASILYSTDGSYPTLEYSAAFNVPAAATVRAIATKTGLQQSDVRQHILS